MIDLILKCLWFLCPAALANPTAVLVRRIRILENPIDFNRTFRNKPLFGKSKTWRGLIFGTVMALIVFAFQKYLYQFPFFQNISLINYHQQSIILGLLLGLGAMIGDLIKSFFKRRRNIAPGESWFPFDQIDWVVGALIFSSVFYFPPPLTAIALVIVGGLSHLVINYLGYLLKFKETKI